MRTRPKLSFDEKENKPLLANREAAIACMRLLKGGDLLADFEADELFLKHYKETISKSEPTQKEINDFVIDLVTECSKYEPEKRDISKFYLDGDTIKQDANG
jgi:hypothetical protein